MGKSGKKRRGWGVKEGQRERNEGEREREGGGGERERKRGWDLRLASADTAPLATNSLPMSPSL